MYDKKQPTSNVKTPNLAKMKAVVIDRKTVIFIEQGASEEEAIKRYLSRGDYFKQLTKRKPVAAK